MKLEKIEASCLDSPRSDSDHKTFGSMSLSMPRDYVVM